MKKIVFLMFMIVALGVFSSAKDGVINIDQIALQEAKKEKKHILVFFHMTHCPYCVKMIDNAFSDKVAKMKMEKDFIFVDVNIDDDDLIQYSDFKGGKKDFSKSLSISFYPTVVFIDGNNEIVYALKGYRDTSTFNHILDYITKKSYKEMDFAGYLTELEFQDEK